MRSLMAAAVVALIGSAVPAQVTGTAGPLLAPVGCPIDITIANDTTSSIGTGACPFTVTDAGGATVFAPPFCILIFIGIGPGQTWTTQWDQRDNAGGQVPSGFYTVNLNLPGLGITALPPIFIDDTGTVSAAIAPHGPMRIGTTRNLAVCSPGDPGAPFMMAASAGPGPTASCGGALSISFDPLFTLSTTPGNGIFLNFSGNLDSQGYSATPAIAVPNQLLLVGYSAIVQFVTINPTATCPIGTISEPTVLTAQ